MISRDGLEGAYELTDEEMAKPVDGVEHSIVSANRDCHITGRVKLPALFKKQREMLDSKRHLIAPCSRRLGKTEAAVRNIFDSAAEKPGLYLWMGESWDNLGMKRAERICISRMQLVWRANEGVASIAPEKIYRKKDHVLSHPNGSILFFKSAQNPDSARGEGMRGAVLDECAFYGKEVYDEIVRPSLADKRGWAWMISTPKGMNGFFEMWRMAENHPDWTRVKATIYDNPKISRDEIESLKAETPTDSWRQEYLAEFVDAGSGVFERVEECCDSSLSRHGQPEAGREYVFGIDFAKTVDFTVVAVWDLEQRSVVHYDRFNRMTYTAQVDRIQSLAQRWKPVRMICDGSGLGIPAIDMLRERGLPAWPYVLTPKSKEDMIERLAFAISQRSVRFPAEAQLIDEFNAFGKEITDSGRVKYGAVSGHDDIVNAVGLGYTLVNRYGKVVVAV